MELETARFAFALPITAEAARACFPPIETWLRLNPQWEVLSFTSGHDAGESNLRVRYERSEREASYRTNLAASRDTDHWRLELAGDGDRRIIELEFESAAGGVQLVMREDDVPAEDQATRTELALWHRSAVDYLLLTAKTSLSARLIKHFLDRVWLRMNPTGRRVALLVIASEAAALALFLVWLLGYWLVG